MNRQQRRAAQKAMGKKGIEKVSRQITQFGNIPTQCSTCHKGFDKKDKSMALSWRVTVRQERVHLFCPDCIEKTQEIINERD